MKIFQGVLVSWLILVGLINPVHSEGMPSITVQDKLAQSIFTTSSAPFSFVYQATSSHQFLTKWQVKQVTSILDEKRISRVILFEDPVTRLQARLQGIEYLDFPAVEWILYLKNNGTVDTPIIEAIQALDIHLLADIEPVLNYHRGAVCSPQDFRPFRRVLNDGAILSLRPGAGRGSSEYLPYFNMEMSEQAGLIIAVGWSGEWETSFKQENPKLTRVQAGLALTHLKLHPQEEIRTPLIALLSYHKGRMEGQNQLRRFILAHHRPLMNGQPYNMPVCTFNWGGTPIKDHLKNIQQIISYDLPIDYYWIDAEWYGKGLWHTTPGDWRVKKDLYPNGFKPISDLLHRSHRKFLLWFEPERISPGTPWYEEHKPWLLTVPEERKFSSWYGSFHDPNKDLWESRRNQIMDNDRLWDLGNPEARKYLTDFISSRIEEYGMDCFRHDANIGPLEFWRAADAPDRQGISEIRWIQGLYDFWDGLLLRHPGLMIDNCASGGRRLDLEAISRTVPLWRTDGAGSIIAVQSQTFGISSWIPLNATYVPTGKPGVDEDYAVRTSFSSGWVFELYSNGIEPQKKHLDHNFPWSKLINTIRQYRSIQPYYYGDYYPLTSYSLAEDSWIAWQFNRPDLNEGMVQVFRRPLSICETGRTKLSGLDRNASYRITDMDKPGEVYYSGAELSDRGLSIAMPTRPSSKILVYKKRL